MLGKRHQGAMEYLLVIGIAVFICAIVLVFVLSMANFAAENALCGIKKCTPVQVLLRPFQDQSIFPEGVNWILVAEVVLAELVYYLVLVFCLRRFVFSKKIRNFKEFFEIEEKTVGKKFKKNPKAK